MNKSIPHGCTGPWCTGLGIGVVAGVGGGLMSLGGGTLVIPLLMSWAGLTPLHARGTAILVSVFSAATGTLIYASRGQVDLEIVLWDTLKREFGAVITLGGLLVIVHDYLPTAITIPPDDYHAYLLGVGVIEGLVAGVIGISGGPILAPLFVLGLGLPQQLAQGCSLAARLPATLSGSWENWRLGNICKPMIVPLAIGALAGAAAGSHLALGLPEAHLRSLFGFFLILLGLHYLIRHRHGSR